jgi:hypothetical protein
MTTTVAERAVLVRRWERASEWPLMIAAVASWPRTPYGEMNRARSVVQERRQESELSRTVLSGSWPSRSAGHPGTLADICHVRRGSSMFSDRRVAAGLSAASSAVDRCDYALLGREDDLHSGSPVLF